MARGGGEGEGKKEQARFADYFRHLMEIKKGTKGKEAEDVELSSGVIKLIPPLLDKGGGRGEERREGERNDQLILLHTPHRRGRRGKRKNGFLIDHCEDTRFVWRRRKRVLGLLTS